MRAAVFLGTFLIALTIAQAQTPQSFDGRPWNVSSGNLSVTYIQHSPIGAYPQPNYFEPPPPIESQMRLKNLGLVANEDYIAWGAVEREPGQWNWQQHDAMEQTLHKAGLKYVVYDWIHFPPVWLRDQQKDKRTLMRCFEHGKEANYLSVFDPRTVEWYDHFYKNLHDHFGDRIDDVYACLLGPYGEGNYPLYVPDWVNMGHCHQGYWCGDEFAIKAFQTAMKKKYRSVRRLNNAWNSHFSSFEEVHPPKEISEKFKPVPESFSTAQDKRRWLDFITWYNQAIIDFAGQSVKALLKYYPAEKVRTKPGGSSGSINPIDYGTYCPGYAKMAKGLNIVLQPADCQGAVFADKWMGTAYQFYGVKECTEPCGGLDDASFKRRMFSDASSGAAQLFTYEFENHAKDIQKYIHLFTGKAGETKIAVYCPTTLWRLGGSVQPTFEPCRQLRDLCEFDVLDELLIEDGALKTKRYKVLLIFQGDIVDQPILDQISSFRRSGGKIIQIGNTPIKNVEGKTWRDSSKVIQVGAVAKDRRWLTQLSELLAGYKGIDGKLDGLWTCRRGEETFVFNSSDKPVVTKIADRTVQVAAHTIWFSSR